MNNFVMENINYEVISPQGKKINILSDINFTLSEHEIVSFLGKSGSGKSTILRIMSGLIKPSSGKVIYQNQILTQPKNQISMIFQNFALFPWLNVRENIKIALSNQNLKPNEIDEKISKVVNIIGLDGYENAYPRELSGGMKQRVGFARALVVSPDILLMDEAFSALDILTAQFLRTDLLDLWLDRKNSFKNIVLVTHNIEEAVFLSDRVHILSSNPGRIVKELEINLPHPRDRLDPDFKKIVENIYLIMTEAAGSYSKDGDTAQDQMILPKISFHYLEAFLNNLKNAPYYGKANIAELSEKSNIANDIAMKSIEALVILKFININNNHIILNSAGKIFTEGDLLTRKKILASHLIQYVALAGHVRRSILSNREHIVSLEQIVSELHNHLPGSQITKTLQSLISWARYADLFSYNDAEKIFFIKTETIKT